MKITTKVKHKWLEVSVEDSNTQIHEAIWENDLQEFKEMLQDAIEDIEYLQEKLDGMSNKDGGGV